MGRGDSIGGESSRVDQRSGVGIIEENIVYLATWTDCKFVPEGCRYSRIGEGGEGAEGGGRRGGFGEGIFKVLFDFWVYTCWGTGDDERGAGGGGRRSD